MRFVLAAVVAVAALSAAFAIPAGAHVSAAPGPQCGGTLWKMMTLSDTGKTAVNWTPAATSVADITKLTAPKKITTARSSAFQKQVWGFTTVLQSYRVASNGELVFQLFDVPTSTYMNAYLPSPSCLPKTTRGRAQIVATRNAFLKQCPAATVNWQPLGATAQLSGVGFWNSVKTTAGASKNGAELRPLLSLNITQGCGKF
jgi:hypothetical protein